MTDFLGRLAQRVVAPEALLQPRLPALFEAPTPAEPIVEETRESVAMAASPAVATAPVAHSEPSKIDDPRPPVNMPLAAEPMPPVEREPELVIVREVLEGLPMEIAASEALAPLTRTDEPPPAAPSPRPRVHTRRAAESRRAPAALDEPHIAPPAAERDVHITIGRIDVRAVTPPARERKMPKTSTALTLDDYLAQRRRR